MSILLDVLTAIGIAMLTLGAVWRLAALTLGRTKPAMAEPGARNAAWRDCGYCLLIVANLIYLLPAASKDDATKLLAAAAAAVVIAIGTLSFAHVWITLTFGRAEHDPADTKARREAQLGLRFSLFAIAGLMDFLARMSHDNAADWLARIAVSAAAIWVLSAMPRPRIRRKPRGPAPEAS